MPTINTVIPLTRLNGERLALNPDLIERAEATPDTVITLSDGTKYIVSESLEELIGRIREYRASVLALAQRMLVVDSSAKEEGVLGLRLLPGVPDPEEGGGQ